MARSGVDVIRRLTPRQQLACLVPLVLAIATSVYAVEARAWFGDDLCTRKARMEIELRRNDAEAPGPAAGALAGRAAKELDFTELAREVPPELRDEVAYLDRELPHQLELVSGPNPTSKIDFQFVASLIKVSRWLEGRCR